LTALQLDTEELRVVQVPGREVQGPPPVARAPRPPREGNRGGGGQGQGQGRQHGQERQRRERQGPRAPADAGGGAAGEAAE